MACLESRTVALSESSAADQSSTELRLVLLGKTGTGKSSTGNTILGREAFKTDFSPQSVTSQCERASADVNERRVVVIDTPGFFDTRFTPQEVTTEIGRCILLSAPGPHMFLVVLQPGRFTLEEQHTLKWLSATFGPTVFKHTMVLFTWGDQLRGSTIEEFLTKSKDLSDFVARCNGGYHLFNNCKSSCKAPDQTFQLLCKIDRALEEKGGCHYTNEMYLEAESAICEAQNKIMREQESGGVDVTQQVRPDKDIRVDEEVQKRMEEDARKKAERLFWCELLTAMGKGAAEGAGLMEKGDEEKGVRKLKKGKVVKKATALVSSPLSLTSAAKVVGGAVREGSKVLYKHRKTFMQ